MTVYFACFYSKAYSRVTDCNGTVTVSTLYVLYIKIRMTSNCVFIQAGQCGNQLGYSLLDKLYSHLSGTDAAAVSADPKKIQQKSTRKHHLDHDKDDRCLQQQLDDGASALEKYFRYNPVSKKSIARSVSLDTGPLQALLDYLRLCVFI